MKYKQNWEETKEKWRNYWKHQNIGTPLMYVVAKKENCSQLPENLCACSPEDKYTNAEKMVGRFRYWCETHEFLAESFPNMSVDFGPGSIASYIGSDIIWNYDTVWFTEVVDDWDNYPKIIFNHDSPWLKKHIELVQKCRKLAGDDFYVGIPDLMENIDVLASLRGVQNMIFDMMDSPEIVQERIKQVSDIYFDYYNRFYDIVKDNNNASCYTVFQIWGEGRTAKLQCDFSALMSPQNFKDFIVDPLRNQARQLDNVLYHLDGPDAIKHLDALMEIEEIDALQWTSGDHGPDGTFEEWYPIYDKAYKAGKSLWIKVYSGQFDDWISGVDRLVKRYGSDRMFLHFPEMSLTQASALLNYAEKNWSNVKV